MSRNGDWWKRPKGEEPKAEGGEPARFLAHAESAPSTGPGCKDPIGPLDPADFPEERKLPPEQPPLRSRIGVGPDGPFVQDSTPEEPNPSVFFPDDDEAEETPRSSTAPPIEIEPSGERDTGEGEGEETERWPEGEAVPAPLKGLPLDHRTPPIQSGRNGNGGREDQSHAPGATPSGFPADPAEKYVPDPTPEEFQAAVADLKPHHCSYPSGRPISKRTKLPCRANKLDGFDVCRTHGGARARTMTGPQNPAFSHGRYSKALPGRAGERFEAALADPELLSLRREIAVLTGEAEDLMERRAGGASREQWIAALREFEEAEAALRAGDAKEFGVLFQSLGKKLRGATEADRLTDRLIWLISEKAKVHKREVERLSALRQNVSVAQFIAVLTLIRDCVKNHAEATAPPEVARAIVAGVARDIQRIANQPGDQAGKPVVGKPGTVEADPAKGRARSVAPGSQP